MICYNQGMERIPTLRVGLVKDGDRWYAQGLEIDYIASGDTVEKAKARFEMGLGYTIQLNLQKFGDLENLLIPAPPNIWDEFRGAKSFIKEFSPSFPFRNIQYLEAS